MDQLMLLQEEEEEDRSPFSSPVLMLIYFFWLFQPHVTSPVPLDKQSKPSHERTAFKKAGHVIVDLHVPI